MLMGCKTERCRLWTGFGWLVMRKDRETKGILTSRNASRIEKLALFRRRAWHDRLVAENCGKPGDPAGFAQKTMDLCQKFPMEP